MIDPSANCEPAVTPLPADGKSVARKAATPPMFGMSFQEQQEVLFETLQAFDKPSDAADLGHQA